MHGPRTDADFGREYWRLPASAVAQIVHTCSGAISDTHFRLLAKHLPTICSIADAGGAIIWLNRRWYEYTGTTPQELAGTGWHGVHAPEQLPSLMRQWSEAIAAGEPFEIVAPLRGADGIFRPFLSRAWPLPGEDGKPQYWFGITTEIGAQLAAEAALQAENVAHAALIAAQQAVAAAGDLDAMLEAVVQGALSVSPHVDGASVELLDGDKLTYRATAGRAKPRQGLQQSVSASLSGRCIQEARPQVVDHAEHDPRANADRARQIGARAMAVVPVFRRDVPVGVLKLMSGTQGAFTERDVAVAQLLAGALAAGFADKAEADAARALRDSEARFQVITDAVDPMIWSALPDGRTDFYNARWYDFVGVPKAAGDVDLWTAVLHPDDWARAAARWGHSIATGEPFEIEYRLRHYSGEYRWALGRATLLRDGDGTKLRWYGTCTDIHDRRMAETALRDLNDTLEQRVAEEVAERAKAEDALRQAQKMEAVGQLTGGIAHDFNNLLTIITGNIDTAARALAGAGGAAKAQRALENAMNGAERAAALTQRLLAFARRQPLAPRAVDVGKLVHGMSDLLNRALGETVELDVQAGAALWQVDADPNQLESAILNLAVNARDAMHGGGRLTIRTDNEKIDAAAAALHRGLAPGDYVVTTVADNGTGMTPDIVSRAFEPFFTTKEVGRGTGLGLSQVYGFVKQSGGYVIIQSEPGQGTAVKICLPRLRAVAAEPVSAAVPEAAPLPTVRETILVVEDDDDVRAYTVECLTDMGYVVLEASHGEAALRLIGTHGDAVDLLFTDVVMPGMSGRELAEKARQKHGTLKVLYTSGYTRDAIMQGGRMEPGVDMIGKPFAYTALAAKLRDVLGGDDSRQKGLLF